MLKSFVHDKVSIRLITISFILLVICYFLFFHKKDLIFFPTKGNNRIDFYTDRTDQGNSLLTDTLLNDTTVGVRFILKKGFMVPYVGFNIAGSDKRFTDVSDFNRMKVQISAQHVKDLLIYLITKDQNVADSTHRLAYRHTSENIKIRPGKRTFNFNFKEFTTPDWWYTIIGQDKSEFSTPEWNNLYRVAFASGHAPTLEIEGSITLHELRFYRDNTFILIWMGLIQFLVILLAFIIFYIKKTTNTIKATPISIHYKAITINEAPNTGFVFLDYINQNFTDPELNLGQIAKATGISQRYISDTISDKFNCNFKSYVNQIRINEAKRLLIESNLNISEIAYSVGFSSPGSFNRVFKNTTGKTPSEYSQGTEM